jgi:hypothetical protein
MDKIVIKNMRNEKSIKGLIDLCLFLKKNNVNEIIEIGSFIGESSEIFAQYFKKVTCFDPWKNGYDKKDYASRSNMSLVEANFDKRMSKYNNVTKIKEFSSIGVKLYEEYSLEAVYIDGNHKKEFVIEDIENWYPKIKTNFFLCGHDFTSKKHTDVKEAVLSFFKEKDLVVFDDSSWLIRKMD